jgi:hypothetical protein
MTNRVAQHLSLILVTGVLTTITNTASAQDLDLDEQEVAKKKRTKKSKTVQFDRDVREIERGLYSKANVGATIYVLNHPSPLTAPVNSLALSIGDDFLDRESLSMAWEVSFLQTVHNGISYDQQPGNVSERNYFQGDTRGFALTGAYEVSKYPTRRFGVGLKLVAGVMGMPVLMHEATFDTLVVSQSWGLTETPNHRKVYIPVGGGPTLEYYTKLAHFSVGADIDVLYIIGWDFGISPTGYLKYTF